ncbi:M48 family metallopeptidase [Nonomuraea sp. CA-141351]|uniref:M48 family metallopeptidase n=1 Tax=Nonomuraea sp. CA-141351 TaxID=3239996 RepID=UPI003D8E430F
MKRLLAVLIALVVHLLTLGFVALGAWIILGNLGSLVAWLLGGVSLAIGWALRPRLGGLPADAEVLDRSSAPELYGIADRVADRVGVRRPGKVAVRDLAAETRYERVGLPRTPVLAVGLPLWLALPPRQRVALLATAYARVPTAEELVVDGALFTLEAWRDALLGAEPLRVREDAQTKIAGSSLGAVDHPGTTYEVMGTFGRLLGRLLGGPVLLVRYALTRLARAGEARTLARHRALALRAVSEQELAELDALAGGGYLAPMQAAALRGESAAAIRQGALARFRLTDDGVLTSPPHSELLGTRESERIDEELLGHYTRAIRGFGLIS